MVNNLRRLGVLTVFAGVMMLAIVLLASSYSELGTIDAAGTGQTAFSPDRFTDIPESVLEKAAVMSQELYGNSRSKYEEFAGQLLTSYLEVKDKDFLIVFNSGGWGWNTVQASPGWQSILDGVQENLTELDYSAVMLDYRRTSESLRGLVKELVEATHRYPSKTKDLACRVQFMTSVLPEVKVILAAESNGSVISDGVMDILRDNPRVYSIQTGPPFWHKRVAQSRTLVLKDNGAAQDTFSSGNIPAMFWASFRGALGLLPPEENPGAIMHFMRAPGHDYSWKYPLIRAQIDSFLWGNFGTGRQ